MTRHPHCSISAAATEQYRLACTWTIWQHECRSAEPETVKTTTHSNHTEQSLNVPIRETYFIYATSGHNCTPACNTLKQRGMKMHAGCHYVHCYSHPADQTRGSAYSQNGKECFAHAVQPSSQQLTCHMHHLPVIHNTMWRVHPQSRSSPFNHATANP